MNKKKQPNKKIGNEFEKKVQKTINSGQLWFNKGDLHTDDYVVECKYTEKKGYRITTKLLQKIWDEALDANKLPLLIIGIKDKDCRWMLKINVEKEFL